MRKSQASANSKPTPKQYPRLAVMTGFRQRAGAAMFQARRETCSAEASRKPEISPPLEKCSPAARSLSLHPAVAEVAVAGVPDERWGQRITAFVKRGGAIEAEALDAWCRGSSLADYKRPREYVFVAEIPKSPVGKILRRLLVAGDYRKE